VIFDWLLGSWRTIGFVVASTVLIYLSVVGALRLGERRTLTEMTAYDFVVAIALGSIIGRTSTTARPSYVQGLTAVVALLLCHHALSWLRMRSPRVRRLLDRSPIHLVQDGAVDRDALRRAHLTMTDLEMVLREHGVREPADARLVVLETRGAFSVITATGNTTRQEER
jgi:uncharacterized membrane protein YcaP (DUF421 family)